MEKVKTNQKKQKGEGLLRGTIGKVDKPFLILVFVLLGIGLVMVASSSYVTAYYAKGDSYYYIKDQVKYAIIGIALMFAAAFFDYRKLRKFAIIVFVVAVVLLILVYTPLGVTVNGARRWVNIGIRFQPSELGKFAIILCFANYISVNYNHMKKFVVGVMPLLVMLVLIVGLVAFETHLSGAILILAVGAIMMFVGGVAMKYFLIAIGLGGAGLTVLMLTTDYMTSRIKIWMDPFSDPQNKGYQIIQSLYAVGSGGVFGLGLGQSRQKHLYIPEPHNDYIFSIICEELGFVGAVFIILLYILLIWRGFSLALHARDKFGSMLIVGIISRVAVQTILNIGVVTNALPSTGIALPFMSYGGTGIIVLLVEMGIVLSVSRTCYMEKVEKR